MVTLLFIDGLIYYVSATPAVPEQIGKEIRALSRESLVEKPIFDTRGCAGRFLIES